MNRRVCVCALGPQVNSLKDLYLLLEEENLTSPSHQADNKMAASEEHPLSPTIKELCLLDKSYSQVYTHT